MSSLSHLLRGGLVVAAMGVTPAFALDGYEFIGFGPRQKALAGSGVADSRDAMSMSLNPAGIVGLPRGFQIGVGAVMPERGYKAEGLPFTLAPGDVRSGHPLFVIGNGAYVQPIDATSAWGVVAYAHGGIHAAYDFANFKPALFEPSLGGPFGGGFARLDNRQAYLSVVYAQKYGALSIGVAPTLGVQMINVQGLGSIALLSRDPGAVTNNGDDWAVGGGVRVGMQYELTPALRVGVSGSTPIFMTKFGSYSGLFSGSFDLPAHVAAGVAYDIMPGLTVMVDWKHIFYGAVAALAKPSYPIFYGGLGSVNGFGLKDTDSESIGLEWAATRDLTLRVGYRHTNSPIGSGDVTMNVLSPGLTEHHAAGGFNYRLTKNSSIDASFVYGFKNAVTGYETVPFSLVGGAPVLPQINPLARITPWIRGSEVTIGYNYSFDADDHAVLPSHF